jgi:hypothetical protein
MIPDKNQTGAPQKDQTISEPVSNPQPTKYRPDWIIPDNGLSSRNANPNEGQQRNQQEDNIPQDNDETLGIP